METNNRTNADFMLRNALRRTETPSPKLLHNIRFNAINDETVVRIYPRHRRLAVAAVLVVALLATSTVALAYTGVLSDFFSAITNGSTVNGGIGNDSRKEIVEQGYVASVTPGAPVPADGNSLELIAYYADAKELGFNFRLSGPELPVDWDRVFFNYFYLEMTDSNGVASTWEYIVDFEGGFERRTFPGGYSYQDWNRNLFEYEPTDGLEQMESIAVADVQDFQYNAIAERINDSTYDITLIVSFHKARVQTGENMRLKVGGLTLTDFGDISDDNAVDNHTILDGIWEFDIATDSRFISVTELQYYVTNTDELAIRGVVIERVSVLPSVCRIEASIDFYEAGLANPDNMNRTDSPRQLGKLDWLDSYIYAVSDSGEYRFMQSDYTEVNGRVVSCWYEIDSMFFDAPESLTLILEGYQGAVIEIPLALG